MSKEKGNWTLNNTGKAFETYVREKKWELKLGRSINVESNARATSWGTLVEEQAFENLSLKYSLDSKKRFYHPDFENYWSGAPDLLADDVVGDIKCPFSLTGFADLVEITDVDDPEYFKQVKPDYYWQLVSNSILCDKPIALFVVYVPYKSELDRTRDLAQDTISIEPNKVAFINWASDSELPHIPDESQIKNINMMQFEVPEDDKQILKQRVQKAIKLLK